MKKHLVLLLLVLLVPSHSKCVIRMNEYDVALYDYLREFYDCAELGRSFVLDVSVDRQLPIRAFYSYDRNNYMDVLADVLAPLGLQVRQGRFSDAIGPMDSRAYGAASTGPVASPSLVPQYGQTEQTNPDSVHLVLSGRMVSGLDSSRLVRADSLAQSIDFPVDLSLTISLLSADTLRRYGISEPEYIASVRPWQIKGGGWFDVGYMAYNDTAADYQSLDVRIYDSLTIAVGPRKRVTQATYSDGKVIETKSEQEQYGLQCVVRRLIDTLTYSCSYSRANDASDYVLFANSLRIGEEQAIMYNMTQQFTSRQGGIFWLLPFLSRNITEKRRYVLAVVLSTKPAKKGA